MNRQGVRIASSLLLIALTVRNPIVLPLALLGIWTLRQEWRRGPDRPAGQAAHRQAL
jgi:hypothetical protein